MTREEAIQELCEWLQQMIDHGVPNYSAKREALAYAISALSVYTDTEPSDIISRADAITFVGEAIADGESWYDALNKVPSVSAERVIRCKDCEYRDKTKVNKKGFEVCVASGMDITDNDFCSLAKMKGGTE